MGLCLLETALARIARGLDTKETQNRKNSRPAESVFLKRILKNLEIGVTCHVVLHLACTRIPMSLKCSLEIGSIATPAHTVKYCTTGHRPRGSTTLFDRFCKCGACQHKILGIDWRIAELFGNRANCCFALFLFCRFASQLQTLICIT